MIKILHIVSDLSQNGGMMSVIMNYYRNIDREKIQFDFLSFDISENDYSNEIKNLGGNVYCLGKPKINRSYIKDVDSFFYQHKEEYKAIHCHPIFAPEVFGYYAKKHGIKFVIAHSHSTKYSNKKISAIRNWVMNLLVTRFATNFMACSNEASNLFKHVNKKDIYILNNAVDCELYKFNQSIRSNIRKSLNIEDNDIVLGHVGRFSSEKNHIFLLDIFNELLNLDKKFKLILVGEGNLENEIRNHISKLNLHNNVILLGKVNNVHEILNGLDIFILPSIFEGVPVSAIEAQASGLKCFLSDSITKNVNINDVEYIALSDGAKKWADTIINTIIDNKVRINQYRNIKKYGFDIEREASKLQQYYINL